MALFKQARDITSGAEGNVLSAADRVALAALDVAVSDTETTGLDRRRNGLTEVASIRAMQKSQALPTLQLFNHFILPLRPEYRDYLAASARAKAEGKPPPDYDRARYEYAIEPQALAVTGTEILRDKGLDGPITGIKVNGKKVKAVPFYEVMDDYLAFTRDGEREAFYNAPFDAPFIGKHIADVRAHDLARTEAYQKHEILRSPMLNADEQRIVRDLSVRPYDQLNKAEQAQLSGLMRRFAEVPECYSNPARWRCFMYGYMAAHGLGPENSLNAVTQKLFPGSEKQADAHSGVQDVALAARVGATLPAAQAAMPGVATMAELYAQMLHRVDPAGSVREGPPRAHTNGQDKQPVRGDIVIQFSDAPGKLCPQAQAYWKFLNAYREVTLANNRVPQHILKIDEAHHTVTINAERADSLMLRFMKKQAFFFQMLNPTAIATAKSKNLSLEMKEYSIIGSVLPYDSTGTVMDVTLRPEQEGDAPRVIEGMNYRSLRANVDFLNRHPDKAEAYLQLMKRLCREDKRVGLVLFKERDDGSLDIRVRGHARAFGDCVLSLPAGVGFEVATPILCRELALQLKLGAIPNIKEFAPDNNGLDDAEDEDNLTSPDMRPIVQLQRDKKNGMQLTISPEVFILMAHRLNTTPEAMLKMGSIRTSHGDLTIHYDSRDAKHPTYQLVGVPDAFHDFVTLDDQGLKGEKPDNIIRDACWLLYRLQQLPGTNALRIEGRMAILNQQDGVSLEALGLLHRLGIPFKAYDRQIKIDVQQLMKNAFTWSQGLGRAQQARMAEIRSGKQPQKLAPPRFLSDIQKALWQGNALAVEANERGDCWLIDHTLNEQGQPEHHLLEPHAEGIHLTFDKKRLVVERSDVQGPQAIHIEAANADGSVDMHASPLLMHLAGRRLDHQGLDSKAFLPSYGNDRWHVPAAQVAKATKALQHASRFVYSLSKTTGSERQSIASLTLLREQKKIEIGFPSLTLLDRPRLYRELMMLHRQLAHTNADALIRTLQTRLIDPREADPRRDNLQHMVQVTKAEQPALSALGNTLTEYLKLLGGAEHADDPSSLNLSRELKSELNTLGLLLHEMASAEKQIGNMEPKLDARPDVHTAQEKISNVAFGADQLREALAVARAVIQGDANRNGGLLREIGCCMATVMDEYAERSIAQHPESDLADGLHAYRAQTIALLGAKGEESFQHYAYQAAMRYLVRAAQEPQPNGAQRKVANYLLAQAYPDFNDTQRNLIIRLYREGVSDTLKTQLHDAFPPAQRRSRQIDAAWLIRQRELLVEQKSKLLDPDSWLEKNPAIKNNIDDHIRKAYQRNGNHYLAMARISRLDASEDNRGDYSFYLNTAHDCFVHAGWDEKRIAAELKRSQTRHFSPEQKAHIRQQIQEKEKPDPQRLEDVLSSIQVDGHEYKARQLLLEKGYKHYLSESGTMSDGISDSYYILKQRKALLSDIEKTLKETHDVLMVKYHHVRDLQGLLVLLSQQESMVAPLEDEDRAGIGEIGARIRHKPEMVGIHDKTLEHVHSALGRQQESLRGNFMQSLASQGVEAALTQRGNDLITEVPLAGVEQLFDRWQQQQDGQKPARVSKPVSPHLYPWLSHVASRLFLCPGMIKTLSSLNTNDAAVTCQMQLEPDLEKRENQWQDLRRAIHGLGLSLPPMPLDNKTTHEIRLPLNARAKRREISLGNTGEALQTFAEAEGMNPGHAASMVERARAEARQPGALKKALQRAGSRADAVRDTLHGYRR